MSTENTSILIYSELATDPDLADIVQMFVDEMPDRIRQLQACYDRHDHDALGRVAHQLKGSAGSYGFAAVSPAAAKLEYAVRELKQEEAIQHTLAELLYLCQCLRGGSPESA